MTTFETMTAFGPHGAGGHSKISKPRGKGGAVRPILKKLSHTEKKSVDLDRDWDQQDDHYRSSCRWGGGPSPLVHYDQTASPDRSFFSDTSVAAATAGPVATAGGRRYHHQRSVSGTSHVSVATSSSSGGAPRQAGATFVHPFQQTPHASTPPLSLSYANSLASIADNRDYSPTTITEDDDYLDQSDLVTGHGGLYIQQGSRPRLNNPHSSSQPSLSLGRPSVTNQRSGSSGDMTSAHKPHPPLRVNTSRTTLSTPTPSRLAHVSSRSDLHLDRALDSPTSPALTSPKIASPASNSAAMSPLRTSLDASGFRLRAKSDVDTATRADHVREARRKFDAKERAKEEKYAREQIRRRERAENKRAQELEREAAAAHKGQLAALARQEAAELEEAIVWGKQSRKQSFASSGRPSMSLPRPSMNLSRRSLSAARPSASRKTTASQQQQLGGGSFASSKYDHMNPNSPPAFGDEAGGAQGVAFRPARRRNTAKRRTQSTWTTFVLWVRTKLLRAGRNR